MAIPAISGSTLSRMKRSSDVRREMQQWQSMSHPEMDISTLYGPSLAEQDAAYQQYVQDRDYAENKRRYQEQVDLQRQQMAEQAAANQISGYTQIATSAANLYKPGKELYGDVKGLFSSPDAGTSFTSDPTATGYGPTEGSLYTPIETPAAQPASPSPPSYTSPDMASVSGQQYASADLTPYGGTAVDVGYTGNVATPAASSAPVATSVAPSATSQGATMTADEAAIAAYDQAMMEGAAEGVGSTAGTSATTSGAGGVLGTEIGGATLGTQLSGIGYGMLAYSAADTLQKTHTGRSLNDLGARMNRALGGQDFSNEAFASGGRGAAAGAAYGGYVYGPIGAGVGAVVGALVGAGLTSLRQGDIPGQRIPGTKWHILPTIHFKGAEGRKTVKLSVTNPYRAIGRVARLF